MPEQSKSKRPADSSTWRLVRRAEELGKASAFVDVLARGLRSGDGDAGEVDLPISQSDDETVRTAPGRGRIGHGDLDHIRALYTFLSENGIAA